MLLGGVRTFGPGSWKKILARFPFHEKRTSVDLKDKYRNIMRARARRAAAEMNASPCSDAPVQVGVAGILPRPHRLPYPTAGYAVPVQAPTVWIPAAAPRADVAYWGYGHAGGGV